MKTPNWRMILGALALTGAAWLAPAGQASAAAAQENLNYSYDPAGVLTVSMTGTVALPDVTLQNLKVDGKIVGLAPDCSMPLGLTRTCIAAVPAGAGTLSFGAFVAEAGATGKTSIRCARISATSPCQGTEAVRIH